MSLQAAAQYLARHGREGDTTLVHMTPDEVRGLQQLAEMHGTTLTINPDTGLPEAFNLKSLLKSVAPIALGAFLGPGAFGISGLGMSAGTAGLLTGGITTALTGSLEKGLMAGLGAYGGAGLAGGVEGLGQASMASKEALAQNIAENIARETGGAMTAEQIAAQQIAPAGTNAMSEGLRAAVQSPSALYSQMGPDALKYTAAAAAPLAMEMSKTDMPDVPKYSATAAIHPKYAYRDPEGHIQFVDLPGVKMADWDPTKSVGEYARSLIAEPVYEDEVKRAADGGMMSAQDLYYSNEPVVRMADGGMTPEAFKEYMYGGGKDDTLATQRGLEYAAQQGWSPEQTAANWNAALGTNFTTNDYNRAMQQFGIAAPSAGYQAAMQPGGIGADKYYQNIGQKITEAGPNVTYGDVQKMAQPWGVSNQDIQEAAERAGLSGAAQYALTHQDIGAAGNVAETYGGLKGLSSNINYWLQQHPGASLNDVRTEMGRWDLSDADILRATGKTPEQLMTGPVTQVYNPAEGAGGNVSAVVNPNGTITQVAMPTTVTTDPVTGAPAPTATIKNLRDLYTAGGGRLGQILAPTKTYANTGSSKGAYDFLMGDASAFPTYKPAVRAAANTFKDIKNPTATELATYKGKSMVWQDGKMVPNPYVSGTANTAGSTKDNLTNKDVKPTSNPGDGYYWDWDNVQERWVTKQAGSAASGGLMAAYAAGGHADLGSYSDGGRLLRGPGDGVSDSIPATIGGKRPARLADGEFVVPARIVSEIGNGSTEAGARKLYAMMERVQQARGQTVGKGRSKVAKNTRADKYLPA